jgi:ABC-type multidrug transport system ATPase subunit
VSDDPSAFATRGSTLDFDALRIRVDGADAIFGLSVTSSAQKLGLVGDWGPLYRALAGEAEVSGGRAELAGVALERAVRQGTVGLSLCDRPLPDAFTVGEYLEHAARLNGDTRKAARSEALRVLDALELMTLTKRKLGALSLHEQRALGLALSAIGKPALVCLETPLARLDALGQDYLAAPLARLAEQHALVVSVLSADASCGECSLLDDLDEVLWLERGLLVAQGPPAELLLGRDQYLVAIVGSPRMLIGALEQRGCHVTAAGQVDAIAALLGDAKATVERLRVKLPGAASADLILDLALATGTRVIEFVPVPERSAELS